MSYKHLTLEERYHIQAYKSRGYTNKEIAKQLGVHASTIGRELARNKGKILGIYFSRSRSVLGGNAYETLNSKINLMVLIHTHMTLELD